jgi:hypothetical protein
MVRDGRGMIRGDSHTRTPVQLVGVLYLIFICRGRRCLHKREGNEADVVRLGAWCGTWCGLAEPFRERWNGLDERLLDARTLLEGKGDIRLTFVDMWLRCVYRM